MFLLFIVLIGVVFFGAIAGYTYNRGVERKIKRGELKEMPAVKSVDAACCGQHQVCEKDSLLAAVSRQIEYYDDEELDRFKHRSSADYSDAEIEEFRDVLYTMREDEVAGWIRSLQLRGIALPDELRDEVILIVEERRFSSDKKRPLPAGAAKE